MSRLEKLIRELCPDGVEYKKLGEIATISRGGNFQKKDYVQHGVPCIHYGQIYTKYNLFVYETLNFIGQEKAEKQKYAVSNDIIMAVTSENIDDVCKCVAWLGKESVAISGHTAIIHHNQNPKFLAYYFSSILFYKQKTKLAHGTKVIEVTPDKLKNTVIPVPPLEVQQEIVRILDTFTTLTTELQKQLEAELEARKKQYEYYRDRLLDFGVHGGGAFDCNTKTFYLREIATFNYGYTSTSKTEGNARIIRITDILDSGTLNPVNRKYIDIDERSKPYLLKKGDLLMARTGATYGKTLYIPDDSPAVYASFLIRISLDNSIILNRYYWHFAQSNHYWKQAQKLVSKGGQPQFNTGAIERVKIKVPSLDYQRKVISILDRFDTLCNGLSFGLPAEIEARQKQYEYYRDKLLTFKEKA